MMKEMYTKPVSELEKFGAVEVMTASGTGGDALPEEDV